MTNPKRKPQPRRTQVLEEAILMLGDRGFNGLTLQALAQRCGMSNAGLLYYFGSKEDTLLAVLDEFDMREREVMSPLVEAIERSRDQPELAGQAFVAMMRQMVARFTARPELARFLFMLQAESLDPAHAAHHWFKERDRLTFDLYVSFLEGMVSDPESTARHLIAAMQGLAQQWLTREMNFGLLEEWERLAALVLPVVAVRAERA